MSDNTQENYLDRVIKLAQDMTENLAKLYHYQDASFGKLKGNFELLQKDVDRIQELLKEIDKSEISSKVESIKKVIDDLSIIVNDSKNKIDEINKTVRDNTLLNVEEIKGKHNAKAVFITGILGLLTAITVSFIALFKK